MSEPSEFCTCRFDMPPHSCDWCIQNGYSEKPSALVYISHPALPNVARGYIPLPVGTIDDLKAELPMLLEVGLREFLATVSDV